MTVRHLIHVGYPKAGSTYLQRWFAAHPRLASLAGEPLFRPYAADDLF